MKARLIATGERAPSWVAQGLAEYQKRLSHWLPFELVEIEPGLRGKGGDARRAHRRRRQAGDRRVAEECLCRCTGRTGPPAQFRTAGAALEHWRGQGRDLAFLIGGPEGHSPEVSALADEKWSIGPLTLPHMLVRLVVAEQLYRAAAMLANHPYHRA